jgi:hypothetical protein
VLLQSIELLFGLENLDEFEDSSLEDIEFPENLSFGEIEVGTSWESLDLLFNFSVLFLIFLVQLNTVMKHLNKLIRISLPNKLLQLFVIIRSGILRFIFFFIRIIIILFFGHGTSQNIVLAVRNHLVSNFAEQVSHGRGTRIIPSDGVDHLNSVH